MALRVTRPGFIAGIKALKAKQGIADYDPNRDATARRCARSSAASATSSTTSRARQGRDLPVGERPQGRGDRGVLRQGGFTDWTHAETGTKMLKAQHPEFEVWNQGVHARAGVACADCHMPYERVGALKVSDHWVRSPLLNLNRACQTCHAVPRRSSRAGGRDPGSAQRAAPARGQGRPDLIDTIVAARKAGASESDVQARRRSPEGPVAARLRRGRELDGLPRAPGAGAILGETIDFARQGQLARSCGAEAIGLLTQKRVGER
jgi:nitrite reductase (cytochrome c-552)